MKKTVLRVVLSLAMTISLCSCSLLAREGIEILGREGNEYAQKVAPIPHKEVEGYVPGGVPLHEGSDLVKRQPMLIPEKYVSKDPKARGYQYKILDVGAPIVGLAGVANSPGNNKFVTNNTEGDMKFVKFESERPESFTLKSGHSAVVVADGQSKWRYAGNSSSGVIDGGSEKRTILRA